MHSYPTIADVFGWDAIHVSEEKADVVWCDVQARLSGVQRADHIRTIIKPEYHKTEKLQDGRLRIIAAVPLQDQLVDRMLFAPQNEASIANFWEIPTKAGYAPSLDMAVW